MLKRERVYKCFVPYCRCHLTTFLQTNSEKVKVWFFRKGQKRQKKGTNTQNIQKLNKLFPKKGTLMLGTIARVKCLQYSLKEFTRNFQIFNPHTFFNYLGFLWQMFTNYRATGEEGRLFFNSSAPLPSTSQTLRHYTGDYKESSPLHIASGQTRTVNQWFPSASC